MTRVLPVFNLDPVSDAEWLALCADRRFAEVDAWITNPTDTPGVADEVRSSGVPKPRKATR
jgi:hypothetical protein